MWWKKLSQVTLAAITTAMILVLNISPGLTQSDFNPFTYDVKFEDLNIYTDPSIPKAPLVIDGRNILSVSKVDGNTAGERVDLIKKELLDAIKSDNFTGVTIKEKDRLPVLYLEFDKPSQQDLEESPESITTQDRRYLFTVTQEDTIGKKSNRETAVDLKQEIEQAIARGKRERSSAYIQRQGIITVGLLILALLGTRLLDQLQTYPFRRAIQRVIPGLPSNTTSQPSNLTTLFRLKLGFAQFILWAVTIFIIFRLFPWTRHWLYLLYSIVALSFNKSVLNFGGDDFSIIELLLFVGLLIAAIIASSYIANLLRTKILQVTRMTRGSQEIISIVTKYGLIALATIILLQAYGLNLSSLALIGSALGVGIGFGLQDIARNFASGIVLLFERSVQVGDFIQVGDHLGVVEEVRTRSIVLKTLDRISIIVPNSRFLSEEVINWNHRRSVSRLHLPIGVAYGSDVAKVKSALIQAAEEHLEVLRNPPPQVFFTAFGDSSLDFELLVWTSDPSRQAPLKSDLCFRIEEIFREQQIDIPFPQRDINIAPEGLPIKLPPQLEGHLLYLLKALVSQQYSNNKTNKEQGTGTNKN
ncbi:mechanosensitive ion channel [Waterburya agarophytonicola K14]|uniref:Mechanosensitive ion channel n=1 Tax=Waterburya agarophytonicola KI4 TaxID=2874699 RepID=A0A964BT16_9CYAN|nr:mechanosensitive ion channel domain-containing protein [Waterburya agarophytonicola]MCC0177320.1 mechanosensitive ion channel [Waterburya agarophytonicola KI4]